MTVQTRTQDGREPVVMEGGQKRRAQTATLDRRTGGDDEARLAALLARWPAPRPPDAALLARLHRIPEASGSRGGAGFSLAGALSAWWQDAALRPLILSQAALVLVALIAGIMLGSIERRPVVTLDVTPLLTGELPLAEGWPEGRGF